MADPEQQDILTRGEVAAFSTLVNILLDQLPKCDECDDPHGYIQVTLTTGLKVCIISAGDLEALEQAAHVEDAQYGAKPTQFGWGNSEEGEA